MLFVHRLGDPGILKAGHRRHNGCSDPGGGGVFSVLTLMVWGARSIISLYNLSSKQGNIVFPPERMTLLRFPSSYRLRISWWIAGWAHGSRGLSLIIVFIDIYFIPYRDGFVQYCWIKIGWLYHSLIGGRTILLYDRLFFCSSPFPFTL